MNAAPELSRLGGYVSHWRREVVRLTVAQAAARAPMVASTWTSVEQGRKVSPATYAGVERVLGWPEGTVHGILSGGEPPQAGNDMPPRLRRALEEILADPNSGEQLRTAARERLYGAPPPPSSERSVG